jgi:hypothetical protein
LCWDCKIYLYDNIHNVATLALGSRPRQRVARLRAKRETWESHHLLPRVQRVWGNEPSHSPVNSHCESWSPKWTPKSSERDCRGHNPSVWKFLYIIEKLLKRWCLKWARIVHLDIWNTSYGQKKGQESNWQFDFRPLKVRNRPNFLVCKHYETYHWKALNEGYNFVSNLIVIWGLHAMLWAPKVVWVPAKGISGLPLGSPETKNHLDVALVERCRVYYKGEGGGFPKSGLWWILWVRAARGSFLHQKCSNYALTTLCWFCACPCE